MHAGGADVFATPRGTSLAVENGVWQRGDQRWRVDGCRRTGRHSGSCGPAPSDHPEFAEFLLEAGIDSMSLNPDSIVAATRRILAFEKEMPDVLR
jgi:hypothetical protein